MIRAPRVFSLAPFAFAALAALVGCSNQGEGERCDTANGDADCDTGLVCTSAELLGGTADICCPAEGSDEPACIPGALAGSASSTSTGASATGTGVTGSNTGAGAGSATATGTSTTTDAATGTGTGAGTGGASSANSTAAGLVGGVGAGLTGGG